MLFRSGASAVKTYYCDNFEEVVAACPVPIVVAGVVAVSLILSLAVRSVIRKGLANDGK